MKLTEWCDANGIDLIVQKEDEFYWAGLNARYHKPPPHCDEIPGAAGSTRERALNNLARDVAGRAIIVGWQPHIKNWARLIDVPHRFELVDENVKDAPAAEPVPIVPAPRCDTCPWWEFRDNGKDGWCHNDKFNSDSALTPCDWWCAYHPDVEAFLAAGGYQQEGL